MPHRASCVSSRRWGEKLRGPFVGAAAWGRFTQKQTATGLAATLAVRFGSLRLARLELSTTSAKATTSSVTLAGKPLDHRLEIRNGRLAILLAEPLTLTPGQTLKITA